MKMPKISQCSATGCSYNTESACHALAITIGDMNDPMCDTFVQVDTDGGDPQAVGQVGACKMSSCKHNESLECMAETVTVGPKDDQIDCLTFERK
jgi:hypothetical protein